MSWDIAVAGTVHNEDVTTPHGRRQQQLGGSAVYFSLAAALHANVHFNGIVGQDRQAQVHDALAALPVDLTGLQVSETPTYHSHVTHDFDRWVAVETGATLGCDPAWLPSLSPASRRAQVLFLGSMAPRLQQDVLAQSSARLIGADSMTIFTGPQHDLVMRVVEAADMLFLNEHEVASLAMSGADWPGQARSLLGRGRLRAVVVKRGPLGVGLVTLDQLVERPAYELPQVIDPTGAGDALAGGFLGRCAAAERDDEAFLVEALEEGLRCAAAAISAFGINSLKTLEARR